MMELLKQLQKKRKTTKVIFLILFIFFNCTAFLYAKVFSSILNIEGAFIQGSILFGKTKPNSKIFFNDKKIFVNNEGDFLLGIGRDGKIKNVIIVDSGDLVEKYDIYIVNRNYRIQKIDGLPKNKVTPNQEELKRIIDDNGNYIMEILQELIFKDHSLGHSTAGELDIILNE